MLNDEIARIRSLAAQIGRPVRIMEVCGTHTMAAFRTGLRSLLPDGVSLTSGPGCPVCVTPRSYVDRAIAVAGVRDAAVATFGDMVRVPGRAESLEGMRAAGRDVRIVYSPLDALALARAEPSMRVVFLGVGFETTAPAVAWTIAEARRDGVANYSVLCGHKTIPEAMSAVLAEGKVRIDGFMCPGHVSVVTGSRVYEAVCAKYGVPCVVAGFEAGNMAKAMRMLLLQIAEGRACVEVEYESSVTADGNPGARRACDEVFAKCDAEWRGLGVIPGSGLRIRDAYAAHDAEMVFGETLSGICTAGNGSDDSGCRCGDVLRGIIQPGECPFFGGRCTPARPVGPCMVSSEGACAAHYRFGGRRPSGG